MPYNPSSFALLAANDPAKARKRLRALLVKHEGDAEMVGVKLGVSRRTVYRYMTKLKIKNVVGA